MKERRIIQNVIPDSASANKLKRTLSIANLLSNLEKVAVRLFEGWTKSLNTERIAPSLIRGE